MEFMSHAQPQSRLDNVNNAADAVNSQRVESAWLRKPDSGIMTISAMR